MAHCISTTSVYFTIILIWTPALVSYLILSFPVLPSSDLLYIWKLEWSFGNKRMILLSPCFKLFMTIVSRILCGMTSASLWTSFVPLSSLLSYNHSGFISNLWTHQVPLSFLNISAQIYLYAHSFLCYSCDWLFSFGGSFYKLLSKDFSIL